MPSVTPWCPFKTHSRPFSLTYLWIYSILSFFLLTRQWCCSKRWQHCCSLVVICLEVSHSWRRVMLDSIACQLCHIFFIISWLCFHHFLLIMLLRAFYTDSSCLLLILAMNLSFVISNDHLEGGTTVPLQLCIKNFFFLINQKWIVYFKMTPNCILCLFGKVSKLCMCFSVN